MIKTFWYIGFPAARPAAAMLGLFTFIATWTNFFWPFIVLDHEQPDASRRAVAAAGELLRRLLDRARRRAARDAAPAVLFIFAGRQLVTGIMQGAVKG